MADPTDDQRKIHIATFGPHLASLQWFDQPLPTAESPDPEWRFHGTSGFIMSFGETWCYVTAGHVINDIDQLLASKRCDAKSFAIHDSLGTQGAKSFPIPFPYEAENRFGYDKADGIDCGAIPLAPHYQTLMKANGVRPLTAEGAMRESTIEFEEYQSMGIPFVSHRRSELQTEKGIIRQGHSHLLAMPMRRSQPPQNELARGWSDARAYFQLKRPLPLDQVEGMSGAPIFGLRLIDGRFHYNIVAIQFAFPSGIVAGCPVREFVPKVQEWLATL